MDEVEFRDGVRLVPDHLAVLMRGIETYTMTYDQAVRVCEQRMAADELRRAQQKLIDEHFRRI